MSIDLEREYLDQLIKKHTNEPGFGARSDCPETLLSLLSQTKLANAIDFGCGKGALVSALSLKFPDIKFLGYDPVFTPNFEWPKEVSLIFSTDVLEHIEPQKLSSTLDFIESKAKLHYHLIACHKASAVLPNGQNAHLTIKTPDWWQEVFYERGVRVISESASAYIKKRLGRRPIAVTHYEILYSK